MARSGGSHSCEGRPISSNSQTHFNRKNSHSHRVDSNHSHSNRDTYTIHDGGWIGSEVLKGLVYLLRDEKESFFAELVGEKITRQRFRELCILCANDLFKDSDSKSQVIREEEQKHPEESSFYLLYLKSNDSIYEELDRFKFTTQSPRQFELQVVLTVDVLIRLLPLATFIANDQTNHDGKQEKKLERLAIELINKVGDCARMYMVFHYKKYFATKSWLYANLCFLRNLRFGINYRSSVDQAKDSSAKEPLDFPPESQDNGRLTIT